MDEEHRIANRHRVLKGGRIHFGGGTIDCTIRNVSETGAALDVASQLGIPTEFTLEADGAHRPCRVVWRKEKRIGVTFDKETSGDLVRREKTPREISESADSAAPETRKLRIRDQTASQTVRHAPFPASLGAPPRTGNAVARARRAVGIASQ
jgi:hypothetical protein